MTTGETVPGPGPRVGPALLRYTALRLLVFLLVLLLVRLFVDEPLLALGVAVLGSGLLSVPLLRRFRSDLNEATAARAERRRLVQQERRSRLDGT